MATVQAANGGYSFLSAQVTTIGASTTVPANQWWVVMTQRTPSGATTASFILLGSTYHMSGSPGSVFDFTGGGSDFLEIFQAITPTVL